MPGRSPRRGQASSSARSASSQQPLAAPQSSSTRPSGVRTDETTSRFWVIVPVLSVTMRSTAPSVSSALSRRTRTPRSQQAVRPQAEDHGQEDGRLLGDRSDRRRDAGQDVLAERVAADEADPGGEGDQGDRDDEEDPHEPVELALERDCGAVPPTRGCRRSDRTRSSAPMATTIPSPRPPTTLVPE